MTTTESIADLQARQAELYAQAEAAVEAERARYPDCQTWSSPLGSPDNEFDPSPAEQQAFADAVPGREPQRRPAHPDRDVPQQPRRVDMQPAGDALAEWRRERAQVASAEMIVAGGTTNPARCAGQLMTPHPVGRRAVEAGLPALPAVRARRPGPGGGRRETRDGRTRSEAAAQLVASTTKQMAT